MRKTKKPMKQSPSTRKRSPTKKPRAKRLSLRTIPMTRLKLMRIQRQRKAS